MAEEEEIRDQLEEEYEADGDDITGCIVNLTNAFTSLSEIDVDELSQIGLTRLKRMKRQIFKAMVYYCDLLPEPEKNQSTTEEQE